MNHEIGSDAEKYGKKITTFCAGDSREKKSRGCDILAPRKKRILSRKDGNKNENIGFQRNAVQDIFKSRFCCKLGPSPPSLQKMTKKCNLILLKGGPSETHPNLEIQYKYLSRHKICPIQNMAKHENVLLQLKGWAADHVVTESHISN